jgi:hypothetical protein
MNSGRAACIGRGREGFAALAPRVVADNEIARDEIDFFPVVVHERHRGVDARIETQKAGAAAHLSRFVQITGEDFLADAGWITIRRRRRPPCRPGQIRDAACSSTSDLIPRLDLFGLFGSLPNFPAFTAEID